MRTLEKPERKSLWGKKDELKAFSILERDQRGNKNLHNVMGVWFPGRLLWRRAEKPIREWVSANFVTEPQDRELEGAVQGWQLDFLCNPKEAMLS